MLTLHYLKRSKLLICFNASYSDQHFCSSQELNIPLEAMKGIFETLKFKCLLEIILLSNNLQISVSKITVLPVAFTPPLKNFHLIN